MRRYLYILLFLLPLSFFGQEYYSNQNLQQNFVYSAVYIEELDIQNAQSSNSNQKIESVTFLDGVKRNKQTIVIDAGGNLENIITHFEYDGYGRYLKTYLPYASLSASNGYQSNALGQTLSFYNTSEYENTTNPYYENRFNDDPSQKVIEIAAPGNSWGLTSNHTIKNDYQIDGVTHNIYKFGVRHVSNNISAPELIYLSQTQSPDDFYISVTKNENWSGSGNDNTRLSFYDQYSRIQLDRSYNEGEPYDTYYVYDDTGNLTYVIPPKASDAIVLEAINPPGVNSQNDYDWTNLVLVDKELADKNNRKYSEYETIETLNSDLQTEYEGQGGFSLITHQDGTYSVNINITAQNPFQLKNGIVGSFNTREDLKKDIVIGTIEGSGYSYTFIIQNNNLVISGSGYVSSIIETLYTEPPTTTYEISQEILDNLCYQYHYDYKNRIVARKIPGKDWEYIVYDIYNRPVLTQEGVLRADNKWHFTKYDDLGRKAYTGLVSSFYSRASLQTIYENNVSNSETQTSTPIQVDSTNLYYTNSVNLTEINDITLLTISYYGDYIDANGISVPSTIFGVSRTHNTSLLTTVTKERVLETDDWITSLIVYDNKFRPIYVGSKNEYLDTEDHFSLEHDFSGVVTKNLYLHQKGNDPQFAITHLYTYDHLKRLLTQQQQIGSGSFQLIKSNEYNSLGRLKSKKIGNIESNPLQTIDYAFNIRGWVKEINDVSNLGSDLFAYKINYNTVDNSNATTLFNGNISEVYWKSASDNKQRGYYYDYDALNRLTDANFMGHQIILPDGDGTSTIYDENYSTNNISYDKNGNIQTLVRYGYGENNTNGAFIDVVDHLSYTYKPNSNKLIDVIDSSETLTLPSAGGNQKGLFFDQTNIPDESYTYDVNGNMVTDDNKYITGIVYNYLNKPTEINFTFADNSNKKIEYVYSALGRKLEKKYYAPELIKTKQYAGAFIYEDNTLNLFMHAEGFVKKMATGEFKYVFQHKDHLGNVRMNFMDSNGNGSISVSEILEEHNYYAFGGKHLGYNNEVYDEHEWKFNGVEQEKMFGLNLYEMDFRQYDVAIGRFTSIDPVIHFSMSTYTAFDNNPIFWSDPSGADGGDYDYEMDRDFDRGNDPDRRGDFIGDTEWDINGDLFEWNGDNWERVENEIQVDLVNVGDYYDEHNDPDYGDRFDFSDTDEILESGLDVIDFSANTALAIGRDYRRNLDVMGKVGKNKNLQLIGLSKNITKFTGPATMVVSVVSVGSSANSYSNGEISGGQFSWDVASNFTPILVGFEFGFWPGAFVGLVFVTVEAGYELVQVIGENFTFDFGNSYNIQQGFSMF